MHAVPVPAAALDEEAASVERLLERVCDATGRVEELEHTKWALVEAFGTGLKLGIGWMPPRLRREVYEALGLRIVVDGMRAEVTDRSWITAYGLASDFGHHFVRDIEVRVDLLDVVVLFEGVDEAEGLLRGRGV